MAALRPPVAWWQLASRPPCKASPVTPRLAVATGRTSYDRGRPALTGNRDATLNWTVKTNKGVVNPMIQVIPVAPAARPQDTRAELIAGPRGVASTW